MAAFSARAWRTSALGGSSLRCCCADRGTSGMSGSFSRHSAPSSSISIRVILRNDDARRSTYGRTNQTALNGSLTHARRHAHAKQTNTLGASVCHFFCAFFSYSGNSLCNSETIPEKICCAVKVWLTCSAELGRQVSFLVT